ncbi:MAG: hypothetical protein M1488_08690 [Gammaproteobacteria bacterium]|nr:hypothetical protein [Gammaproteobacteria bacterium]
MDIKLLFKLFVACFGAILSSPFDNFGREFCQLFGLENWFAYFSARTQKNAIAVRNFIPKMGKIGNFGRVEYDQNKSFPGFHKKIFPIGISQMGAVGKNLIARRSSGRQGARRGATGGKKQNKNNDSGSDGDGGEPPRHGDQLVDLNFLSVFLGLQKQTVKNRLSASPESLPPPIYLPCTRGPRWFFNDVIRWVTQFKQGGRS